jgi:hypothetical protein
VIEKVRIFPDLPGKDENRMILTLARSSTDKL